MENLVSIIIPAYNSGNFIVETLKSASNQSYKNIEIVVVDDHSEDNTLELVREFSKNEFRLNIKVFSNPRKGACAARNFGFEQSSGNYIQFLDADDVLSEDKIEKQIEVLKHFGSDYVCFSRWGRFYNDISDVKWANQSIDKDFEPAWQWLNESWQGNGMGQTSIWLVNRDLIAKAGAWDETLLINQDGDFFARVLLGSKGVKFVDVNGVYYRSGNSSSISQNKRNVQAKAKSLLKTYTAYLEYAKLNQLDESLKIGLGTNFLMFVYQYYGFFPDLANQAEQSFYSLGYSKMWAVGGRNFVRFSKFIGFKNALKIKKVVNSVIN